VKYIGKRISGGDLMYRAGLGACAPSVTNDASHLALQE